MVGNELVPSGDKELALYELETRFAMAVRQRQLLENYIKERLHPDKHFYTVGDEPGRKPSLTKEGAELICLPHNLKGHYDWLSGPENPPMDDSPYQITMKCILERNGLFEGEGVGSASSMVTKKDGTRVQRQRDPGLRHNATIKMACKSAYIAATLNSTAASEFFTQDLEDDQSGQPSKHWCPIHHTPFFKKGKMKSYAHPVKDENGNDTGEWCHERTPEGYNQHEEKPEPDPIPEEDKIPPEKVQEQAEEDIENLFPEDTEPQAKQKLDFDPDTLLDQLKQVKWKDVTVKSYLKNIYKVDTEGTVIEVVTRLTREQRESFFKEIQDRLEMA